MSASGGEGVFVEVPGPREQVEAEAAEAQARDNHGDASCEVAEELVERVVEAAYPVRVTGDGCQHEQDADEQQGQPLDDVPDLAEHHDGCPAVGVACLAVELVDESSAEPEDGESDPDGG